MYGKASFIPEGLNFKCSDKVIEITSEYTYLGCVFQTIASVFKEHLAFVLTKAARATQKVQNLCAQLGTSPPLLGLKLFNSLVLPSIEYRSEVWSADINRFH